MHLSASPGEHDVFDGGNDDTYHSLWVNWSNEIVNSKEIDWRQDIANAKPDEGDFIDIHDTDVYSALPAGKLFRDMIREEVHENW